MNKKTAVRIVCWVLAVLMILSGATIIFSVFANAEEPVTEQATQTESIGGDTVSADVDTAVENENSEYLPHIDVCTTPIRVGIFYIYGSNNCLAFSHNIFSDKGLMFYSEYDGEYTFFHTSDKMVTIMRDFSAAKNSSGSYYFTTSSNTHIIYHCITSEPVEKELLDSTIESYKALLPEGTVVFPMYISGMAHIAVGTYSDKAASEADCSNISSLLGAEFVARVPNNTCLSVVENSTGKILFKIDTADCRLFVRPIQSEEGKETYIKSSVGNIFDGTFEYKATIDGMYLVNILELDDYVKSVLPYEISSSWPEETLKAFSVVVRSYTLSNLSNNHRNQDFDMCDETHCQAYRGRLRSTSATDTAVDTTKNMVLAYNGQICKTFYSAIAGGMTEAPENVWYSSSPYLKAIALPFEKYWKYTYGEWSTTLEQDELFDYLESKSSVASEISAPIKSVRISEYTDAGYAYKLEIVDRDGNVAKFEKTDTVRTLLSKYCKSARFSIGKLMDVNINGSVSSLDVFGFFQTDSQGNAVRYNAMANGTSPTYKTVLTGSGEAELIPSTELITISGTGWGHGVGMSQYGAKDMAEEGYVWHEIATYFFPGAYLALVEDLNTALNFSSEAPEENAEPPNENTAETEATDTEQ